MDRERADELTAKLIAGTISEAERTELRESYYEVAVRTAGEDDDDNW